MKKTIGFMLVSGMFGVLIGFVISQNYVNEQIHDMEVEAVQMECGFWNVNGEFDWKFPELTLEDN